MYWDEMKSYQFEEAIEKLGGLCVLPVSGLDKHGKHLPVGTDGYIANAIIEEATKLEEVVVFPMGGWIGDVSAYHINNPDGTPKWKGLIEISQDLQATVLEEICDEIGRNGFRKVLLICKQPSDFYTVGYFLRQFGYEKRDYALLRVNAVNEEISKPENVLKTITERRNEFPMITEDDIKTLEKWAETEREGENATYYDAALVMAKHDDLVVKDGTAQENGKCGHCVDSLVEDGITFANMKNVQCEGADMEILPDGCTKSIGEAILKINAEHMAKVFKLLKEDEKHVRMSKGLPPEEE